MREKLRRRSHSHSAMCIPYSFCCQRASRYAQTDSSRPNKCFNSCVNKTDSLGGICTAHYFKKSDRVALSTAFSSALCLFAALSLPLAGSVCLLIHLDVTSARFGSSAAR